MMVPQLYQFARIRQLEAVTVVSLDLREGENDIAATVNAVIPVFETVEATVRSAISTIRDTRSSHEAEAA